MTYMLMIFGNADWADTSSEAGIAAGIAAHDAFEAFLQGRGLPFTGEALQAPRKATTVHRSGDVVTVTDGPFIDLKEGIGGFYLIDVETLDDAVDVAKRLPSTSAVEIRPVYPTGVEVDDGA